ncbi:MAG: hypothetical protein EOL88_07225 [Bacteroidia bacterium]|nr:hypothetical protein [Bacteroidales bacterium]NCD41868.1 hypothetical protein [Bacteroidia bacterium]
MKTKTFSLLRFGLLVFTLMFSSCLETRVTNTIRPNGSVVRKVEVSSSDREALKPENFPVPVDDSWTVFPLDTSVTKADHPGQSPDTLWTMIYEKKFVSAEALNTHYEEGTDKNKFLVRSTRFEKHFKWFYTLIEFTEAIAPLFEGVDPAAYFNEEELEVFNLSDKAAEEFLAHPDSIQRKALMERVEEKKTDWMLECIAEDFIQRLVAYPAKENVEVSASAIRERKEEIREMLEEDWDPESWLEVVFDAPVVALFGSGILDYLEETGQFYETVFDATSGYTMHFVMPGKLLAYNGIVDAENQVNWVVIPEKYFTTPFLMQAKSRVTNLWAWFITAFLVLLVASGGLLIKWGH